MSYNMQLANEKSEAEKYICSSTKEFNISYSNIKEIN